MFFRSFYKRIIPHLIYYPCCYCFTSVARNEHGGIAQWLEQSAHNRLVAGSNPARPTKIIMENHKLKEELALDLYDIGALKFGNFTFKSGIESPMYLDLRLFISYPKILKKVARIYAKQLENISYDRLAGVAYAALPIAGAISLELEKPWIFMRKEGLKKEYGLQKSLEGEYKEGETVVMIEDLVTRATSLMEAIPAIENHGLTIKDAVVLLDYEKGGRKILEDSGYKLHAFMTITELVTIMHDKKKIDQTKYQECLDFLAK